MSSMSAEERDGDTEEEENDNDTDEANESVDSHPNYFPGNVKTIC